MTEANSSRVLYFIVCAAPLAQQTQQAVAEETERYLQTMWNFLWRIEQPDE